MDPPSRRHPPRFVPRLQSAPVWGATGAFDLPRLRAALEKNWRGVLEDLRGLEAHFGHAQVPGGGRAPWQVWMRRERCSTRFSPDL